MWVSDPHKSVVLQVGEGVPVLLVVNCGECLVKQCCCRWLRQGYTPRSAPGRWQTHSSVSSCSSTY